MFTATYPPAVQILAREFLRDPIQVNIGNQEVLHLNQNITQKMIKASSADEKPWQGVEQIGHILTQDQNAKIIIFMDTRHNFEFFKTACNFREWKVVSMHGGQAQTEREAALRHFATSEAQIIVATDVAARGIDFKDVSHVLVYDFPVTGVEEWVHRVGRTGRAGATGTAITLFDTVDNYKYASELIQILTEAQQEVPSWLHALLNAPPPRNNKLAQS
jgi:ATP-dependent RNA helicase DDX5/DBP2